MALADFWEPVPQGRGISSKGGKPRKPQSSQGYVLVDKTTQGTLVFLPGVVHWMKW
jgi:hypothetical protein